MVVYMTLVNNGSQYSSLLSSCTLDAIFVINSWFNRSPETTLHKSSGNRQTRDSHVVELEHTFSEKIRTFPQPWPSAATLEPLSLSWHRRTRPDLQQAQRLLGAPGSLNWDGYGRSCLASLMVARTRPVSVCLSVGPAEDTALNTRVRPAGRNG